MLPRFLGALVLLAAPIFLVAQAGCASSHVSRDEAMEDDDPDTIRLPGSSGITLEHDFGVVRPGTTLSHRFKVRNSSDITWTLGRIHVNCACTVPESSPSTIAPATRAEYPVTWRLGPQRGTKLSSILIEFKEPEAPAVRLQGRADVQPLMAVGADVLDFQGSAKGMKSRRVVEVENYSAKDWPSLDVKSSVPWLRGKAELVVDFARRDDGPRQRWRCVVEVQGDQLPIGNHAASIEIDPRGESIPVACIPVTVSIAPPVRCVPGELFFGGCRVGEETSASVDLLLASEAADLDTRSVSVTHALGEQLDLKVSRVSERRLTILGKMTPAKPGMMEGRVTVSFARRDLPPLTIPVLARAGEK